MASIFIFRLTIHLSLISQVVFLLVLPITAFSAQVAPVGQYGYEKELEFKYYIIESGSGPNATTIPVAGVAGENWSPATWGTIEVSNPLLVEYPSPYSRKVGESRGLVVAASKDGSTKYNGSTLEVQGTLDRVSRGTSELSIVGGTGKMKNAKGSVTLQSYFANKSYSIIVLLNYYSQVQNFIFQMTIFVITSAIINC
ncbi:pterocarpan synthase 1-like [Argentina anserina]|uniref:pterocarpan synthase 1-like n=1 Tax=Argentina anserina TaxID=57926 RepID=UPI0021762DBE|nr:pterocarpan synthase 1-like [Potentilla anserina]